MNKPPEAGAGFTAADEQPACKNKGAGNKITGIGHYGIIHTLRQRMSQGIRGYRLSVNFTNSIFATVVFRILNV